MFNRVARALRRRQPGDVGAASTSSGARRRSGGCSRGWARRRGILDLGAGTLDGALEIARRAPGARVAAADFAREMLRAGRAQAAGAARAIDTHAADGHDLPYRDGAFDGAFSAFCVRNLRDLPRGLGELRRVVRPGGRVVILEFLRPEKTRFFFDRIWNAARAAAARLGGHRRPRRLPLPARFDRRAFARPPSSPPLMREVGFASVETQGAFPFGRRDDGGGVVKLVVAVGGASGSVYAKRLLDTLAPLGVAGTDRGRSGVHQLGQRGLEPRDRRRSPTIRSSATACATSGRRSPRGRRGGTPWWSSPARRAGWRASRTGSPTISSGAPPT